MGTFHIFVYCLVCLILRRNYHISRWTAFNTWKRIYSTTVINIKQILDAFVVFAQEWNFRMVVLAVAVEEVEVDVVRGYSFSSKNLINDSAFMPCNRMICIYSFFLITSTKVLLVSTIRRKKNTIVWNWNIYFSPLPPCQRLLQELVLWVQLSLTPYYYRSITVLKLCIRRFSYFRNYTISASFIFFIAGGFKAFESGQLAKKIRKKGSSSSKSSKTLHHCPKNKVNWLSASAQFHYYKRPRSCGIRVLGGLCHRCITYTSPQSFHTYFYLYHLTR